jgi:hypothetical protein
LSRIGRFDVRDLGRETRAARVKPFGDPELDERLPGHAGRAPAFVSAGRTHAVIICLSRAMAADLGAEAWRASGRGKRSANEEVAMEETVITEYARELMQAHGDRAIAEAAQRAIACEQEDDEEGAQTWRHVESALKEMRGPRVS